MRKTCKIVLFVLMVVIVLVSMTACGKTKLDLTEGVYVVFSGTDGTGRAEICFSEDDPADMTPAFLYKLMDAKKVSANDWQTLMTLGEAITYDLDKAYGLSNGDTVTVIISVNNHILESLDMKAEPAKLTFQVKGLTEVKTIQPFRNFEISFSGISPHAKIKDYTRNEVIDGAFVSYSVEEYGPYRDGQTITVRASLTDTDAYRLAEETTTVTVSGVDKYISDISELQSETLNAMKAKADAIVSAQIQDWEGYYSYDGFEYVGYEFWHLRESNPMWNDNAVYLYYKINANDGDESFPIYFYVSFEPVLQHPDGSQEVDLESFSKPRIGVYDQLRQYPTLESRTNETASKFGKAFEIQKSFQ